MPKPIINHAKCTKCSTCVGVCPVEVFKLVKGKIAVDKPDECIGCRACEAQCPEGCIKVED